MSHAQRTRRRRRGSGGPRNKALPRPDGAGDLRRARRARRVGYIVSVAASAPPLSSLKPRVDRRQHARVRRRRQAARLHPGRQLHLPLRSEEIPQVVKDATIAIEDERFYKHKGVDYEGVVRAGDQERRRRARPSQGGSTITMQLVRSLYISNERTYTRKIREAKLAEELEDEHSKEWILEKYLDSIPYGTVGGQSAIGIKAAAKIYFSKDLKDLTLREAALLAGLPQAPSNYSPTRSKEAAKARRNEVLRKMAELGMVTRGAGASRRCSRNLGIKRSQFFTRRREEYFFDYVKDQLFREYGAQTVRQGGMKVYTTIDLDKQEQARDTIADHLARHRAVVGDRHDQPAQRLHRGDGVVGRLRRVELQPRRPGPPPARLDVQGDGADDRAAARRRPGLARTTSSKSPTLRRRPDLRQVRDQDLRRHAAAAT